MSDFSPDLPPHYPRDMVGYGRTPPHAQWPKGARVALQFVLNYEEGAENCVLHGDPASETFLSEIIGALLVTADHGNCELMRDPATGGPHTSHTTNPVPIFLAGRPGARLHDGKLADLAPTLLALMGLTQPKEMTGQSLID